MAIIEEQRHFLSLMSRPGDYTFIDISKLDIGLGFSPRDLRDIDAFTMHFTKEEIIASIKRANIASNAYLNGSLVVADNQKHKPIIVIDRDFYNNFEIDAYLKEKITNKEELNTLINKFRSISKNEEMTKLFSMALKNQDIITAMELIFNIPYLQSRKYIVYLIEQRNKELELKNKQERIRDKAA